jgi:hypothetical protein
VAVEEDLVAEVSQAVVATLAVAEGTSAVEGDSAVAE